MIRNIIFDMGNVLLKFDRELFLDRIGASGRDRELLMKEVFLSPEWVMMDAGELTEHQAAARMQQGLPEHLHHAAEALTLRWDEPLIPIDGMYELVSELKDKGYGVYLLSNASVRQHEYWPRLPASALFDGTLISADVKIMKPQAQFYSLLLEKFHLRPEECFFVDDVEANIAGGRAVGIDGFVFRGDAEALRGALRTAGVNV